MASFTECLRAYEHEDYEQGSDKNTAHSYGPIYDPIFAALRARNAPVKVLEIGLFSGAALQAIADYLPEAEVYGVDITLQFITFGKNHPRIHMYQMDGTKHATAQTLGHTYDLIIEDGSHMPIDQIRSLEVFGPQLAPGGVYVLEDIAGANVGYLKPVLGNLATKMGLTMEWVDLRQEKGRHDDILAIFRTV